MHLHHRGSCMVSLRRWGEAGSCRRTGIRLLPYDASGVLVRHTGYRMRRGGVRELLSREPGRSVQVEDEASDLFAGPGGSPGPGLVPQGGVQDAFLRESRVIGPTNPAIAERPVTNKNRRTGRRKVSFIT